VEAKGQGERGDCPGPTRGPTTINEAVETLIFIGGCCAFRVSRKDDDSV